MLKSKKIDTVLRDKIISAFEQVQNFKACQEAYCSGVYFCLILALSCEELGRPDLDSPLWPYLKNMQSPYPATKDLILNLNCLSAGRMDLKESLVPNTGLRYGVPGKYYALAIKECLDFCVFEVRYSLANENPHTVREVYLDWIDAQMKLVRCMMP